MSMNKTITVEPEYPFSIGEAFVASKTITVDLPTDESIKEISIRHVIGTLTGGAGGTAPIANTLLTNIKMYVGGVLTEDWVGAINVDEEPLGPDALRVYNRHSNGIEPLDDQWDLNFPLPLPSGQTKVLQYTFNTIGNIQAGSHTAYDGKISIYLRKTKQKFGKSAVRTLRNGKLTIGTATSQTLFLDPIKGAAKAIALIICTEDNGGAPSNSILDNVTIKDLNNILFDSKFTQLQSKAQTESRVACKTGWAIVKLGGRQFGANQIKIDITCVAGTAKFLHWWIVCIQPSG